jgi:hypothetical protein
LWSAWGPSARSLEKGDAEENSDNPPLVLVNPVKNRANLVFECLTPEPDSGESNHDARDEQREELLWSHFQVADKKTHDVGARHQKHGKPAGSHGGALGPFIDTGHFAHLGFGPSQCPLAKDATCEIQGGTGGQDAEEANGEKGEWVNEWHRTKEVSVSGTEEKNEDGVVVDESWADIATDCSCGKENGSDDQQEATHSENRSACRLFSGVASLLRFSELWHKAT